jgi:type II secretory pathway component GspD/PulD (secretin)/DNA uptake protein ComE-like DNA-binding protein
MFMEGCNGMKGPYSLRSFGRLAVLIGLLSLLVTMMVSLPVQADRTVQDLYSEAVGEYTEENYKKSHDLLQKILRQDPNHAKSRNLLREVRSKLPGEPDKPLPTPGDTDRTQTEELTSDTNFQPLTGDRRRSSSPTPPEINQDPERTIEHVNRDLDETGLESPAVHGLIAKKYSDRIRLHIQATDPIGFIGSRIYNPPMIILDLPQSLNRLPDSPLPLDLGRVVRARHSQYRTDPVRTTRVVVDLEEWNDKYRVYRSADGEDIVVDIYEESTALPPETPMAQRMGDLPAPEQTEGARAQLKTVKGDSQALSLESEASQPLALRVTDRSGNPLPGETVVFNVTQGPGEVSEGQYSWSREVRDQTDPGGFARARFRSDTKAGRTVVEALVPRHGLNAKFQLLTKPGEPAELVPVAGDRQTTLYGRMVPTPLVIAARDEFGNPVPGVNLKVTDQSGKGQVDLYSDSSGIQVRGTTNRSGRLTVDFYRTAPDVDKNHVRVRTYREGDPDLETKFTIFGQPQLISIDFKDANLQDVLRTLAELADWNIAVTEETGGSNLSDMSVTVHLQNVTALRALDTILDVKGLSRVSDGNVMKIVSKQKAIKKGVSVLEPEELEDYPANNIVTVGFKLRYLQATEELASQLQETLLADQSSIVADKTSNSLVVTDLANNLKRLSNIISDLDRQDQLYDVRVFSLDRRDPESLAQSVRELLPTGQGNVVAHRASNTLLVYADPGLMDQVSAIVKKLDKRNPLVENLTVLDVSGYNTNQIAKQLNTILGVRAISLQNIEFDFGEGAEVDLDEILGEIDEVDMGKLVNSAKILPLEDLNKIIVFGPQNIRSAAEKLINKIKEDPSKYITDRDWTWLTFDNVPLNVARDVIDRFGTVEIQAALTGRKTFLLSSKDNGSIDQIRSFIKNIDDELSVGANKELVVYSAQYVDGERLAREVERFLTNLVEGEESEQDETLGLIATFNELSTGDKIVYADQNIVVMAVEKWEADFVKKVLSRLDKSFTEDQVPITYAPKTARVPSVVSRLQENDVGQLLYQDENKFSILVPKAERENIVSLIREIDSQKTNTYRYKLEYLDSTQETIQQLNQVANDAGLNVDFTLNKETNQILFSTAPGNKDDVRSLIKTIDKPGSRNFNIVTLDRRRASEKFVKNVQPIFENLGLNVELAAEPRTNSILFAAPPESSDRIRKMLERLDDWQQQVLIKAVLVEVQLGEDEQVNPEWLVNPRSNRNQLTNTGRFDNDGLGLSFNVGQSGEFTALLNSGDFQGVLNWIEGNEKTNVVTRPSITALNNQQATLDLSRQRYFETVILDEDNNPTQTQFESQEASRRLSVTPTVTESDNVIMDIAISNDVFGQRPAGNAPFPKNNRSTENQVMVGDGQTLVLGGIIQSNQSYREEKVPILGDIPLVGNLFRSLNEVDNRTELIVFITPHVLSTPDDLKKAADQTMGDIQNMERPSELRSSDGPDTGGPQFQLDDEPESSGDQEMEPDRDDQEDLSVDSELFAPGKSTNLNSLSPDQLSETVGSNFARRLVSERRENGFYESMADLKQRLGLSKNDVNELSGAYEVSLPVLNVNRVSEEKLSRLPGIDEELAGNIVSHRFTQGKFRSLQGLYQVFGMTEETFRTIRPYLRVD